MVQGRLSSQYPFLAGRLTFKLCGINNLHGKFGALGAVVPFSCCPLDDRAAGLIQERSARFIRQRNRPPWLVFHFIVPTKGFHRRRHCEADAGRTNAGRLSALRPKRSADGGHRGVLAITATSDGHNGPTPAMITSSSSRAAITRNGNGSSRLI